MTHLKKIAERSYCLYDSNFNMFNNNLLQTQINMLIYLLTKDLNFYCYTNYKTFYNSIHVFHKRFLQSICLMKVEIEIFRNKMKENYLFIQC